MKELRYFVMAVQHNKEVDAENRTTPSSFGDLKDARQKFHEILSNDMKNKTLDWSVAYILTNEGDLIQRECWEEETEPIKEPTE